MSFLPFLKLFLCFKDLMEKKRSISRAPCTPQATSIKPEMVTLRAITANVDDDTPHVVEEEDMAKTKKPWKGRKTGLFDAQCDWHQESTKDDGNSNSNALLAFMPIHVTMPRKGWWWLLLPLFFQMLQSKKREGGKIFFHFFPFFLLACLFDL